MARRSKQDNGPTVLAAVIDQAVQTALLARLRVAAEQEGEALAKELLQDEAFRADFLAAARHAARTAVLSLTKRVQEVG